MIKIEIHDSLPETTAQEWDAFLYEAQHAHPRQMRPAAAVVTALGHDVLYVLGRKDGRVCATGLFTMKRSGLIPGRHAMAEALSGPVCDDPLTMLEFLSALTVSNAFSKVDAISITPYWLDADAEALAPTLQQAGWRCSESEPVRYTGLIDLSRPIEAIRAGFSKKARRKLLAVEKTDVVIREVETLDEADTFFKKLNRLVQHRHGLTPVSKAEYETEFRAIREHPSYGVMLAAYRGGTFLGGVLRFKSARVAHGRRIFVDPAAAGELRIAPALLYQGMIWAKAQGCHTFDIEGFRQIDDTTDPLFKVFEYKRELRPTPAIRIGEHALILNETAHRLNRRLGRIRVLGRKLQSRFISTFRKA